MKLQTKYHGIREYNEEDVIVFEKGIPGFEGLNRFILFPVEDNEVFNVLHSIQNNEVGIIITSPFSVMDDYEFKLNDEVIERLKVNTEEDVLVMTTVTLSSNIKNITTNLRAPMIINIKEKIGEQIILNNERYLIKYPIFKEEV